MFPPSEGARCAVSNTCPIYVDGRPRTSMHRKHGLSGLQGTLVDVGGRPNAPYPPVIGGKNAISRAPAITASALTWARSMAVRITLGFSKAWAYSSPRWASHAIRSATVAMPGGGSTSSAVLPMRSRTQAKYRSFTLTDLNPSTRDYRLFR